MRPSPPPTDDLGAGPVYLDAGQPTLEIPTDGDRPVTIRVRPPTGTFGPPPDPDAGRLENVLGVPRPWVGDVRSDPRTGVALSRAQRRQEPRSLPPIQELPIQVRGLTVTTPEGRPILENLSVDIAPGEILAVAGPADAAADAFVRALTARATFSGRISYGALHLTPDTAPLVRSAIGITPRENLLTGPMPLRRALAHTAALRQPDASRAQRRAAVGEVAHGLGLRQHLATPLGDLDRAASRRAAIAMDVLSRASVLALHDPTAGLDPDSEAEILRMLQALAQAGRRTIVMTTHSAMAMSVADNVLLLDVTPSGAARLGYHGPPAKAATHFGAATEWDFAQVYAELADPQADWSSGPAPELAAFDPDAGPRLTPSRRSWPSLVPAVRRLAARRLEEYWWRGEGVLALFAPGAVLVVIALAVLGWGNLDPAPPTAEGTSPRLLLGFAALAAVLPALVTAAREIVPERLAMVAALAVGMSPTAYVLGRYAAVLTAGVLPALLPVVLFVGQGGVHGILDPAWLLLLGAASAAAVGLLISAAGRREARVLWVLGGALVAQVLLCSAFVAIDDSALQPAAALTPGYWVFRGLAASQDLIGLDAGCRADARFCSGHWSVTAGLGQPVLGLVLIGVVAVAGAVTLVRGAGREN